MSQFDLRGPPNPPGAATRTPDDPSLKLRGPSMPTKINERTMLPPRASMGNPSGLHPPMRSFGRPVHIAQQRSAQTIDYQSTRVCRPQILANEHPASTMVLIPTSRPSTNYYDARMACTPIPKMQSQHRSPGHPPHALVLVLPLLLVSYLLLFLPFLLVGLLSRLSFLCLLLVRVTDQPLELNTRCNPAFTFFFSSYSVPCGIVPWERKDVLHDAPSGVANGVAASCFLIPRRWRNGLRLGPPAVRR